MKKTLIALAVPALLVASAANAATVYEKDGQKFDVTGRAQVNLYDKEGAHIIGRDKTATRNTLVGSGRIGLKGSTAINSQVAAFGRGEWQVNAENSQYDNAEQTSDSKNFKARHLFLGFDGGDIGKILFGQTDTPFYDTLAATDYFNEWGDEAYQSGRQEGQVIYSGSWADYRVSTGYQFADASKGLKNAYSGNLGYTFSAIGIGVGAGAESRNYDENLGKNTTLESDNRWAVSTSYGVAGEPGFYAAALYTKATKTYYAGNPDTKEQGWEFFTSYTTSNKWTLLGGYNRYYQKDQSADVTAYYAIGAKYDFTANFNAYTEYRFDEGKTSNQDNNDAVTLAAQYNF